jgi:hypothetical protein
LKQICDILAKIMSAEAKIDKILIVLGKNWKKYPPKGETPETFNLQLSRESELTAAAAANIPADLYIFSTGKTAGSAFPGEGEAQFEHLLRTGQYPVGTPGRFGESFDTLTDAQETKRLLEDLDIDGREIGLITLKAHLPRALGTFLRQGVPITHAYASETVLETVPSYQNTVNEYTHSWRSRRELAKERLLLYPEFVIFNGSLAHAMARRVRQL